MFAPKPERRSRLVSEIAVLLTLRAVGGVLAQPPSFIGLGDLPGGLYESFARGVSADGSTAVGRSISAAGPQAFRWTAADGMAGLGDLSGGSFHSEAYGVSDDGTVVVGWSVSSLGVEAFEWRLGVGLTGLGSLQAGPGFRSEAYAVTGDGSQVFGRSNHSTGFVGFAKPTGSPMFPIPDLPGGGTDSVVMATCAGAACLVGRSFGPSGHQATRWTAQMAPVALGDPPGGAVDSQANDVTPNGSVIVGFGTSDAGTEAFRWTAATGMQSLGHLPSATVESKAWAVSHDGGRVVGWSAAAGGARAFVWESPTGIRNLNDVVQEEHGLDLQGWIMVAAYGVSADGLVVVGLANRPGGATEAFRLEVPPDGDFSEDGRADGRDITGFVVALLSESTDPGHRRHGDYVRDGVIDAADLPGFVQRLVGR